MRKMYDYAGLLEKFLNHEITVKQFERIYIDEFLADETEMNEKLFLSLDWLFAEVDAFVSDPQLIISDSKNRSINEDQLRESVKKTLNEILGSQG